MGVIVRGAVPVFRAGRVRLSRTWHSLGIGGSAEQRSLEHDAVVLESLGGLFSVGGEELSIVAERDEVLNRIASAWPDEPSPLLRLAALLTCSTNGSMSDSLAPRKSSPRT